MKPLIRSVLRSSVYQIMWMDNVPDSAVCNEAVRIVSGKGLKGLKGFVNGVLRNICRNKQNIKYPDKDTEPNKYLSVFYSCPEWIVSKLTEELGMDTAALMLEVSLKEEPVSVRIRAEGEEESRLIKEWKSLGTEAVPYSDIKGAYRLFGVSGVKNLPGFSEGKFIVQSYGSMLVALMAGIFPGAVVMDLCAAPGGKSLHAADLLRNGNGETFGHVYSYDISLKRCESIRENVERLGVSDITVSVWDATVPLPEMEGKADVVIVDAPCSGLGVMGHKSDIKYRIKPEDIASLAKLQRDILDNAVRYVKPGGRLVYSTCTVSREENTLQKEYILENYPFSPVTDENGAEKQLIPGIDESDGFYIAVFGKDK